MFILCDCKPGFIIDFIVYSRSEIELNYQDQLGISGSIVTILLERFLNKGHLLFVDNFYFSPALVESPTV
jgi:hypothetical protein